jgi:hypothetical protein
MSSQQIIERNARRSKALALVATLIFHLALFAGIAYSSSGEDSSIRQKIEAMFGKDTQRNDLTMKP